MKHTYSENGDLDKDGMFILPNFMVKAWDGKEMVPSFFLEPIDCETWLEGCATSEDLEKLKVILSNVEVCDECVRMTEKEFVDSCGV